MVFLLEKIREGVNSNEFYFVIDWKDFEMSLDGKIKFNLSGIQDLTGFQNR